VAGRPAFSEAEREFAPERVQGRLINYDSSVFAAARVAIIVDEED